MVRLRHSREPDYSDHERDIIKGIEELQATITELRARVKYLEIEWTHPDKEKTYE
jgi:hypothetical protein